MQRIHRLKYEGEVGTQTSLTTADQPVNYAPIKTLRSAGPDCHNGGRFLQTSTLDHPARREDSLSAVRDAPKYAVTMSCE